jgi:hypothetical protein
MTRPPALFPIALALGVTILALEASAREPTPIKTCQRISKPDSYKLANDLSAHGNCLTITTGFVTIDLGGFSIRGNGSGTGIFTPTSFGSITVRNGTVSNFQNGIDLSTSAGSIIEGLHLGGGSGANVGIHATGIVKGNDVEGWNGSCGISARGLVTGNYLGANIQGGICISDGGSAVIGNTVVSPKIAVRVVCPSLVTENAILGQIITSGEGCNITNNANLAVVGP